jgi:hypothetical protein
MAPVPVLAPALNRNELAEGALFSRKAETARLWRRMRLPRRSRVGREEMVSLGATHTSLP